MQIFSGKNPSALKNSDVMWFYDTFGMVHQYIYIYVRVKALPRVLYEK